jgi:propanediol dehydratase small subunit
MLFRTELITPPAPFLLSHQNKLLTIGSCFSQVIGQRLANHKFDVLVNPYGTIFNPISIARLLEHSWYPDQPIPDTTTEHSGYWWNHHVHSDWYATSHEALLQKLEAGRSKVHQHLQQTDTLLITFGTAYVYRRREDGVLVANCHKVPASHFTKELLTVEEIVLAWENLQTILGDKINIVLTVSPVRHTKDTLPLNAVSKAVLRLACHLLSERFANVHYFPSYEIMQDDLRDYRFYKDDLLHPTEMAEQYIWEKFSASFFSSATQALLQDWDSVQKALRHKPFREDSAAHKRFLEDTLQRLLKLRHQIPVEQELASLQEKLAQYEG